MQTPYEEKMLFIGYVFDVYSDEEIVKIFKLNENHLLKTQLELTKLDVLQDQLKASVSPKIDIETDKALLELGEKKFNPTKDESLRDYIIDKILENNEPDQVLIDICRADLHALAEQELKMMSTEDLKEVFEGN